MIPIFLFLFLYSATLSFAFSPEELANAVPLYSRLAPNRFIVEFETSFEDVQDALKSENFQFSVESLFDSPMFSGMSVHITNANSVTVDEILSLPSVKNAWQASYVTLEYEPASAMAPKWNPHSLTGVDTLHSKGFFGDGIRIAVIDSGLDINHEAFRDKKIDGYDFSENPQLPENSFEDTVGHGTFVSSIIVGSSHNFVGVAPNAEIKMYKVFGKGATTTDDIIVAALLKAYSDSPDVISLSLGSDRGYPSMPISMLASKISELIPIVFAAGNSGKRGPFRASSGASGNGAIAVASVESTQLVTWSATLSSASGQNLTFQYVGNKGTKITTDKQFKVDFIGNACFAPKENNTNSEHFLMGIRGTCTNSEVFTIIKENGYAGAIFFVSSAELHVPKINTDKSKVYIGLSTNQVRNWLRAEVSKGFNVMVTFDQLADHTALNNNDGSGGEINHFSSWGPTFDHEFYPHIAAPGGNVFGAQTGGGYSVSSGSSYACPYIAGVIALYLAETGRVEPSVLRKRLIGSGKLLKQAYTTPYTDYFKTEVKDLKLAPLIQQGHGLIDVLSLWNTNTTLLSEPYFLLNDTNNRLSSHKLRFVNENPGEVVYTLSHRPLDTVYARDSKKQSVSEYWPEIVEQHPTVEFSNPSVVLKLGEEVVVNIHIEPPKLLDTQKRPIFQGAIDISGSNGETITVPYIGSEFEAKQWKPFGELPQLLVKEPDGMRKILPTDKFGISKGRIPYLYYGIKFATTFYSIDIVDKDYQLSNYQIPLKEGEQGYHGPVLGKSTPRNLSISFPLTFSFISSQLIFLQPQAFANGTSLPSGTFRLLCRALKSFGRPEDVSDWELYLTDEFIWDDKMSNDTISLPSQLLTNDQMLQKKKRLQKLQQTQMEKMQKPKRQKDETMQSSLTFESKISNLFASHVTSIVPFEVKSSLTALVTPSYTSTQQYYASMKSSNSGCSVANASFVRWWGYTSFLLGCMFFSNI